MNESEQESEMREHQEMAEILDQHQEWRNQQEQYEDEHENADRPNGCLALQALAGTIIFVMLMSIFW